MLLIRRIFGLLLLVATALGLLFSLVGIYFIWSAAPTLTTNIQNTVNLFNQTLETTSQGLVVTKDALKSSVATIASMSDVLNTTAKTIESTNPMIDEIALLMDEKLPNTIRATQESLNSAQESALVIDQVLMTLSAINIPLIGSPVDYNPAVPLSAALGDVAQSLEGLPESFAGLESSLRTTQSNVQVFQADLTVMASSVGEIEDSVAQYELVVNNYQLSLDQVQSQLEVLSAGVPNLVRSVNIALTVFLVWMALAQIGLFAQGWEMFTVENM